MPTKIIHLITSLEGGGTENFLYQLLAHSPAGYDHQVLYLKKDGVIGERLRRRQITVRPAGSPLALYQTLRKESPRILHTCLYSAHQVGRVLGKLAHVPAVITSQRSIDIWQKPWQRVLDRWTLPLSNGVIVNSHAAADVIKQRRRGTRPDIVEVPNGADHALFKTGNRAAARAYYNLPADAVVGGTLMRLHSEKGADFIPLLAAHVLPIFPNVHFLIGGVGPLGQGLKEKLAAFTYGSRIHWVGWENDAPRFLSACDFFWSLSREESFPQTLVEASTVGLPWVAPDTGGVPELLAAGAAGRIFRRLDLSGASEQVSKLLRELAQATADARAAVPKIQADYSLQKMISRIYAVFARY